MDAAAPVTEIQRQSKLAWSHIEAFRIGGHACAPAMESLKSEVNKRVRLADASDLNSLFF